jgi:hypothetical protein
MAAILLNNRALTPPQHSSQYFRPRLLVGGVRAETGTEKIGTHDRVVADGAVEMLLDHIPLALLDTREPIRDVQAVSDVIAV